ncbi:MAG TPA: class I SAM-dependent methyltransferase [Bryobacteraceae bacterium]|nr:class I SAM-dependent methyltransferase [Bryobacteraceae bacterium]
MPSSERYGVYDQFAWFYQRGWGADYHAQLQPVLENSIFPRLRAGARILDLCCGSGDLTRVLAGHGFSVTGIDGSEQMLAYARRHVPGAEFRLDDARDFASEPVFDAVLSTFDSLNHILTLAELQRAFESVARALVPGGTFIFDLNMEEAFATLWRGSFSTVEEAGVGITNGSYDAERGIGRAEVTLFRPEADGRWRRSDVTVLEKCYTSQEVAGALERAGFGSIEEHEAWELGMRGDIALGRTFFFAALPAAPGDAQ